MSGRDAWQRKFERDPAPWRGPVHALPLLHALQGVVLELGAGGGKVGDALPKDALALDWAALPKDRPAVWADVMRLPIRNASIDGIVAIHVLGHADAEVALQEIARVLRPGGALVLEVFAKGDVRDGAGERTGPDTYTREGIATRYFERSDLMALLSGFTGDLALEERTQRWGTRRVLRGILQKR